MLSLMVAIIVFQRSWWRICRNRLSRNTSVFQLSVLLRINCISPPPKGLLVSYSKPRQQVFCLSFFSHFTAYIYVNKDFSIWEAACVYNESWDWTLCSLVRDPRKVNRVTNKQPTKKDRISLFIGHSWHWESRIRIQGRGHFFFFFTSKQGLLDLKTQSN